MGAPSKPETGPQAMPQSAAPRTADRNLRGFHASSTDIVTRVAKLVPIGRSRVLAVQRMQPILFKNFIGKPSFRPGDALFTRRPLQGRARFSGLAPRIRQTA